MARMTVSIPDSMWHRLRKKHPEVNWTAVVKNSLLRRLEKLEKLRERGEL